jgi:hypothetical protein
MSPAFALLLFQVLPFPCCPTKRQTSGGLKSGDLRRSRYSVDLEWGDRDRDGKRQSDEERRVARVISGIVVVAMVIPAMPISAAVATMCVVSMTSVIAPMIIPVMISMIVSVPVGVIVRIG